QGVPDAALGALPLPLVRSRATLGTHIGSSGSGHSRSAPTWWSAGVKTGTFQQSLERFERVTVTLPALHRTAIEWLTHLRGTGRDNRCLIAVERQTGRIPFQMAEIQQRPRAAFLIVHHVLVPDIEDPARRNLMPVLHEFAEADVVLAG